MLYLQDSSNICFILCNMFLAFLLSRNSSGKSLPSLCSNKNYPSHNFIAVIKGKLCEIFPNAAFKRLIFGIQILRVLPFLSLFLWHQEYRMSQNHSYQTSLESWSELLSGLSSNRRSKQSEVTGPVLHRRSSQLTKLLSKHNLILTQRICYGINWFLFCVFLYNQDLYILIKFREKILPSGISFNLCLLGGMPD